MADLQNSSVYLLNVKPYTVHDMLDTAVFYSKTGIHPLGLIHVE